MSKQIQVASAMLLTALTSYLLLAPTTIVPDPVSQTAGSRDFVAWMKTVPPSEQFGSSGFKALVTNINPSLAQAESDSWISALSAAATAFPTFCNTGVEENDKKEFAAFLTITGAETSFSNGFPCVKETGCPNCQACSYNSHDNGTYKPCYDDPKLQYYGRGPLQLSWDTNYYNYSIDVNDPSILSDPDSVVSSSTSCWQSAIWFWMTKHQFGGWCMPVAHWPAFQQCNDTCYEGPGGCSDSACTNAHWLPRHYDSCHNAIHGGSEMSQVVAIINGGYDCCPTSNYKTQYGHITFRFWWYNDIYKYWTGKFAYDDLSNMPMEYCPLGEGLTCARMNASSTCWSNCCNF